MGMDWNPEGSGSSNAWLVSSATVRRAAVMRALYLLDYKSTSCTAHASHQRKSKRAEGQIVFILPTLKGLGQEIELKYLNNIEQFQY
jgi:hypothetical protein